MCEVWQSNQRERVWVLDIATLDRMYHASVFGISSGNRIDGNRIGNLMWQQNHWHQNRSQQNR